MAGKCPSPSVRRSAVAPLKKTRVFISFDYDHDSDLRVMLSGQGKRTDAPFAIADWSIKKESKTWKREARDRIRRFDVVVVICGPTPTGPSVSCRRSPSLGRRGSRCTSLRDGRRVGSASLGLLLGHALPVDPGEPPAYDDRRAVDSDGRWRDEHAFGAVQDGSGDG